MSRRTSSNGRADEILEPLRGDDGEPADAKAWKQERERLLAMLAQQQRIAHTGLITSGLVHEIANHIMLISGTAYMAARSSDPSRWREVLEGIPGQCDELAETMKSVLAFAGRRKEGELESFHVSQVLRQAVRLVAPLARTDDVSVVHQVEHDAVLVGDQQMLVQAVVNLATNGIRACAGQTGRVRLVASRPDAQACRIEVHDDGSGVPEYLRAKLFRPFVTGAGGTGGHGLGLFIVRQTVRRMGGTIRVETSPEGTCVRIDLPASE